MSTSQRDFPYRLTRLGIVMTPDPANPEEADGVLNPAAALGPDGTPYLFPRIVAAGNRSQIARAEVVLSDGVPTAVERRGVVLAPDRSWERGASHGGVEDPRITWIPSLGYYVMAYVAYGPRGPRAAMAVSTDTATWQRLGPVQFAYDDALGVDLNLCHNKDLAWFPEVVPDPDGVPSYAFIHRPMFTLELSGGNDLVALPPGVTDSREAIWISYVPAARAEADIAALCRPRQHRELAAAREDWEAVKIGGGAPPIRVPQGWLLIYHGVMGSIDKDPFQPQKNVRYCAGAMILSADHPERVIARTTVPLLEPDVEQERVGTVANVVFPTATLELDHTTYIFYGMADAAIGVARLDAVS